MAGCSHKAALPTGPPCTASAGNLTFGLETDQAANAATISAVGLKLGLPDHAVTIALATALQESKLVNVPYGDMDSLGLFQQRPSQGWGTAAQVMTPRYAAAAFYLHLEKVPGWETLSVTDAAQAVQHSGAPDAYAQWEDEARVLAQALTGELPAAFSCWFPDKPADPVTTVAINDTLSMEMGPAMLGQPVGPTRAWQVAGWLISHAQQFGLTSVTVNGQRWTAKTGKWQPHPPVSDTVVFAQPAT